MSKIYLFAVVVLAVFGNTSSSFALPACLVPYNKVGNKALDFNHYRLIRPILNSAVEYIEKTATNPQFASGDPELTIFAYEIVQKYLKKTFPKDVLKKAFAKDDDWTNFIERHPKYYRRAIEELAKGYNGPFCPEGKKPFNKTEISNYVGLNLHLTIDLPAGVSAGKMIGP